MYVGIVEAHASIRFYSQSYLNLELKQTETVWVTWPYYAEGHMPLYSFTSKTWSWWESYICRIRGFRFRNCFL